MIRHIWVRQTMAGLTRKRRSFTLTELLVTIAIIAILMGIAWGAIARVREQARVAKTKSTIAKINQVIMAQYDSYRTRRVPIDTRGLPLPVAAKFRLWAIRCIMAWEMPDHWDEIDPIKGVVSEYTLYCQETDSAPVIYRPVRAPILWNKYVAFLRELRAGDVAKALHSGNLSEEQRNRYGKLLNGVLLYMVVTVANPGSRELFQDNEIGFVDFPALDENGNFVTRRLPVFVDGWGNPILFIRNPVGFTDSDLQIQDASTHHDPFDPLRVDSYAYASYPLIFSAGPDGAYGLSFGASSCDAFGKDTGNPGYFAFAVPRNWLAIIHPIETNSVPELPRKYDWYNLDEIPGGNLAGAPYKLEPNDDQERPAFPGAHFDNIHNHRAETMP